jgi:RES domain-containing protein
VIVWRISNYLDLSGQGGLRAHARWHHAGRPVVYVASSPAAALLEVLVHLELEEPGDWPQSYRLLQIAVPDDIAVAKIGEDLLEADWRERIEMTRMIGDAWLSAAETALLAIPSAIVPHTHNYLMNPLHPDSQRISVLSHGSYPFDFRLFKTT